MSVKPGHTAFTRTPARAPSSAAVRVSPTTACLLAEYAACIGKALSPATLATLTITPPPAADISGNACRTP